MAHKTKINLTLVEWEKIKKANAKRGREMRRKKGKEGDEKENGGIKGNSTIPKEYRAANKMTTISKIS